MPTVLDELQSRIKELERAEKRWATLYAVMQALAESATIESAAPRIIESFCTSFDWAGGELWQFTEDGSALKRMTSWPSGEGTFRARGPVPPPDEEGLLQTMLRAGHPLILSYGTEPPPVNDDAGSTFYPGVAAFPISADNHVCGGFVFYGNDIRHDEGELLALFEPISIQIGQFVERRRAERALSESEERFRLVARATKDTLWDWNLETNSRWWSDAVQRTFGYAPSNTDSHAESWVDRIHPHDRNRVVGGLQETIDSGERSWSDEYRFRRADGTYAFVLDRGCVVYDSAGKGLRMIGSIMDMTELKRAEEELKRLTARLLEAQEAERRRVSRELHDRVNQILSAAKFRAHALENQSASDTPNRELPKPSELIERAVREVRSISRNLRPTELDDLGLLPAIRSACEEFRERTGIELRIESAGFPEVLSPEVELGLYRIMQEALNNIEKHSGASCAAIVLYRKGSSAIIWIRDNGRGFSAESNSAHRHRGGLGLLNMKERAGFVGGTIEISSAPDSGTEITVVVPIFFCPDRRSQAEAI